MKKKSIEQFFINTILGYKPDEVLWEENNYDGFPLGQSSLRYFKFDLDGDIVRVRAHKQPNGDWKVEEVGIIAAIESPEEEMPSNEEEVASPAEEEMSAETASPKKVVKSITEEMFFSEIEKLRNEIAELKLSKDKSDEDLKSVEVKEVELSVEPLTHSPEIKPASIQKFASSRPLTTQDRVMAKLFNK